MDYASQQRNSKRNMIGLTGVVLLHVFIVYALMTGLGHKAVKVLVKPLETKIIEEFIPPPPPPPPPPPKKIEPQMPKVQAPPPPPYVPPPEVQVAVAPAPVITQVQTTPPVVEPVIAPPPPPALVVVAVAPPAPPPPPPAPPKPKVRTGVTPQFKEDCTYPREALRKGVAGGDFMTLLNVDEKGNVTNVELLEGKRTDGFERELKRCLAQWRFVGEGEKYQVKAPFEFKLTE